MFRPFWVGFPYYTAFWGDQPAGKVAINCIEYYFTYMKTHIKMKS